MSLAQSREAALHLLTLLEEEKGALEQNDLETLETVILSKAAAVDKLQKTMTTRDNRHAPGAGDGLHESTLNPILQQCRDLNEHNHRIASARHRAVSALLSTIRGADTGHGQVYGKDGQLSSASSSSLGSF